MSSALRAKPAAFAGRQRGYALLLTMVAMVMASLTFLVQAVSSAGSRLDREEVTRQALVEAKRALIGRAAMASQGPGHFVCPDIDNDGDSSGNSCAGTVGRLPWKTLELQDLRDASGERLWYAVSERFINQSSNTYPVNSDTKGQIQVNGLSADDIIAVVFAPGPPLPGQSRNTETQLIISNYLEGGNADESTDAFEARIASGDFNDQLILIRAEDVFPIAEAVVIGKMERDFSVFLHEYKKRWKDAFPATNGHFPRPAPFANPSQSNDLYCGGTNTLNGLLPVGKGSGCLNFANILGAKLIGGTAYLPNTSTPTFLIPCTRESAGSDGETLMSVRCSFDYINPGPGQAQFQLEFDLAGWTRSLALPIDENTIQPGATTFTQTWSGVDTLDIDYTLNLPPTSTTAQNVTVTIPVYYAPKRLKDVVDLDWYFDNEWYRNTYYAISPNLVAGGTGTCVSGNHCLSVIKPDGIESGKNAVLVLSGMALKNKARPSATLSDYFEGDNIDADLQFEYTRRGPAFNDKAAGVTPPTP